MAYAGRVGEYSYDIIIYDLISNKKENIIKVAQKSINCLKHYYHASTKKHYLLTVSDESAILWSIHHSNQLEQILLLSSTSFACVLFIKKKCTFVVEKMIQILKFGTKKEMKLKALVKSILVE